MKGQKIKADNESRTKAFMKEVINRKELPALQAAWRNPQVKISRRFI
jgi:hypothetical protein